VPVTGRPASWRWILALNGLLAASVLAAPATAMPGPVRMIAAGLLVLVLPGAGWLGLFRKRALPPPALALAVVGLSTLASLTAMLLTSIGPDRPARGLAVAWTVLAMNAGLVLTGRPGPLSREGHWKLLGIVALAGFLLTSLAALHLVPPLEDHDMELRGSAWSLATTFKPYYLTNRELYVQAAHPVLFHFHIAESLLFTGEIEATLPSFESALRARAFEARGAEIPWGDWWRSDYEAFLQRPALVGTRAPSCLLSALSLALLCHAVIRLTGSAGAGIAASVVYMSFPETVVRAS
jgi:hypothetical protein